MLHRSQDHLPQKSENMTIRWRTQVGPLCALFFSFALDVLSKNWASHYLRPGESQTLFPPLLQFSLVTNTGVAFSVGHDHGVLVSIITTVVFLALLFWYWRQLKRGFESHLEHYGLAIVIGGALGNLLERYMHGHVTDFLEFTFVKFPVFNLADVMIDVGIGLIVLANLFRPAHTLTKPTAR
jgi:signal peptidase II